MRCIATVALVATLPTLGCYANTFATGAPPGERRFSESYGYTAWGTSGEAHVSLDECGPAGPAILSDYMDAADVAVSVLTLGIYSQKTVEVICATSSVAEVASR